MTSGHPVLPELRRDPALQFNKDVHIEEGVWIGAGVVVLPGVTIGRNSVIGAGSIVTRDIPENTDPCRVLRSIGDKDRETFFRNERIDWEELNG